MRSSNYLIWDQRDIEEALLTLNAELCTRNDNAIQRQSGLTIKKVALASIFFSKFEPLVGNGFKALPPFLRNKRAIVNVQNKDNRCFGYAILAALLPQSINVSRAKVYDKYFEQFGLNTIQYPVSPDQICEIEQRLNLKINVFSFFDDEGKGRFPLYISKQSSNVLEVDLLYWNQHYAWIKNFNSFIYDLSGAHDKKNFCKRCFGVFLTVNSYKRHLNVCSRPDMDSMLYSFPAEGSKLSFKNIRYQLKAPFIIYADFEALLVPNDCETGAKRRRTKHYQEHIPSAVGVYIVSQY